MLARGAEILLRLRAVDAELIDREAELCALLAPLSVDLFEALLRLEALESKVDNASHEVVGLLEQLRQLARCARLRAVGLREHLLEDEDPPRPEVGRAGRQGDRRGREDLIVFGGGRRERLALLDDVEEI